MTRVGILGGTGPYGLGLGTRLAAAGHALLIGSRASDRARAAADAIRAAVPEATVEGLPNAEVARRCTCLVVTVPFDGLADVVGAEGLHLAGKLVVDVVVPLRFVRGAAEVAAVPGAGSVGEYLQGVLPQSRVVSAFKNVPAQLLRDPAAALDADVLICGDDAPARAAVAALAASIPGLRPVDAGCIASARALEAITALLVNLNRLHGTQTSIRITGLPPKA